MFEGNYHVMLLVKQKKASKPINLVKEGSFSLERIILWHFSRATFCQKSHKVPQIFHHYALVKFEVLLNNILFTKIIHKFNHLCSFHRHFLRTEKITRETYINYDYVRNSMVLIKIIGKFLTSNCFVLKMENGKQYTTPKLHHTHSG